MTNKCKRIFYVLNSNIIVGGIVKRKKKKIVSRKQVIRVKTKLTIFMTLYALSKGTKDTTLFSFSNYRQSNMQ